MYCSVFQIFNELLGDIVTEVKQCSEIRSGTFHVHQVNALSICECYDQSLFRTGGNKGVSIVQPSDSKSARVQALYSFVGFACPR
jgi:hypothetical protein